MKLALEGQQQEHYRRYGFLEVADLVSPDQLARLNEAIDISLSSRLKGKNDAAAVFMAGHDLFRSHPEINKCVRSPRLARLVHELTNVKAIRIGCDQLFSGPKLPIEKLFDKSRTLDEIISIQGIITGMIIRLSESDGPSESRIPQEAGNVVFLAPHALFNFDLLRRPGKRYLLIVYAEDRAQYVLREIDPHTHFLKTLGYGFGDTLHQNHHPLVFR